MCWLESEYITLVWWMGLGVHVGAVPGGAEKSTQNYKSLEIHCHPCLLAPSRKMINAMTAPTTTTITVQFVQSIPENSKYEQGQNQPETRSAVSIYQQLPAAYKKIAQTCVEVEWWLERRTENRKQRHDEGVTTQLGFITKLLSGPCREMKN